MMRGDTMPSRTTRALLNADARAKECGCGADYTLEQFRALPFVGAQLFADDPQRLEMRNCICGSTLAIWTDRNLNMASWGGDVDACDLCGCQCEPDGTATPRCDECREAYNALPDDEQREADGWFSHAHTQDRGDL